MLNNSALNQTIEPSQDLPPEISKVLQDFADVFQEPKELPQQREVITLLYYWTIQKW